MICFLVAYGHLACVVSPIHHLCHHLGVPYFSNNARISLRSTRRTLASSGLSLVCIDPLPASRDILLRFTFRRSAFGRSTASCIVTHSSLMFLTLTFFLGVI